MPDLDGASGMLRFDGPCTKDGAVSFHSAGSRPRRTSRFAHVRFFDRAPENGRWPGPSQRRHRYQDPRCDAGGAARGICPANISARWPISTSISMSASGAAAKRFLIKPVVTAKMLQAAEIKQTDNVLVVGCATGYAAAIVANLAGRSRRPRAIRRSPRRQRMFWPSLGRANVTVRDGGGRRGQPGQRAL